MYYFLYAFSRHTVTKGNDDHLKSTRSRVVPKEKVVTPIEEKQMIENEDDDDYLDEEEKEEEVVVEVKKTTSERWGELLAEAKKVVAKTILERVPDGADAPIKTEITKNLEKFKTSLEW